ncbi:LOW QUALITY PROTEIN: hypothetical protein T265_14625 [Opisthorchis viverrini]|uniref:Uncharacterized protein n=1 Tax=Opisthorchis viverrini TaxID=6198 RepID=A0A074ZCZ8_OPIVI|nr:LOW QUALITY PROTEIN: hypothetical protein T265_14625 [Opisthorchis viverrini]KER23522.1 LOW QUALITY PROTEIN: hypothetical protein T265_14625 [Opisthorchis viverrini]
MILPSKCTTSSTPACLHIDSVTKRLDLTVVWRLVCLDELLKYIGGVRAILRLSYQARWPKWLEREFTDRKVRGSNPAFATRLPLSRLRQPGSIPALVLPSGGMAARHRKGATAERFLFFLRLLYLRVQSQPQALFKPRKSVRLAAFSVRTLKQAGQQVGVVRTLDSLCIDVCCLSETRTEDASTVIDLAAPLLPSRFRLCTSGDAEAAAAGYTKVGIVLSERAEASLLDWIPSPLCCSATSVRESGGSKVHRTLLIVSAYAPTDCSSESGKKNTQNATSSRNHRISDKTVSLLETRRHIPPDGHYNSTWRIIRRQVKLSVCADGDWWIRKSEEMEDAKNAGNARKLFHLIRPTGLRKSLVIEIIRAKMVP